MFVMCNGNEKLGVFLSMLPKVQSFRLRLTKRLSIFIGVHHGELDVSLGTTHTRDFPATRRDPTAVRQSAEQWEPA